MRRTTSVTEAAECSTAEWSADIPEAGEYAVYVSYRSLPESAEDACYTVRHLGGESRFAVNQTMGGGTWIYLGTFPFAAGRDAARVVLSNLSSQAGRVVTADAVKIGGGMGSLWPARCATRCGVRTDAMPRSRAAIRAFCEGARYWLQWAGFGEEVHSPRCGTDDYKGRLHVARALWVNALAGGSERLPEAPGLGISGRYGAGVPLRCRRARDGDETIGTLGIFYTRENGGPLRGRRRPLPLARPYGPGDDPDRARRAPHVRARMAPPRTVRSSYYEARVPGACRPCCSNCSRTQNFADMRYGSDPRFRFVVSRAVYKGILRYLGDQYGVPYVVQPLPVADFSACLVGEDSVRLARRPEADTLEPTARPKGLCGLRAHRRRRLRRRTPGRRHVVHAARGAGTPLRLRVTAVNDGGESFPGETLSVCPYARGPRMRAGGERFRPGKRPARRAHRLAGRLPPRRRRRRGVGHRHNVCRAHSGSSIPLRRTRPDERCALGACGGDYAAETFCGNTFDYPRCTAAPLPRQGGPTARLRRAPYARRRGPRRSTMRSTSCWASSAR